MRGHPLASPAPCAFIPYPISHAARLCLLGRIAPRPAPRAAVRSVIPPFRPSCRVACCSSPSPAPPTRPLPLACFPSVPHRHGSRLVSPPSPLLSSPRPSPRRSCRENGETPSFCLLSCVAWGAGACGFSSCLVRVFSACLVRFRSCLKTLLGNLLKICLGKLLKTFTGNLLKTIGHIPLSICPSSAFLRLRRSTLPLPVLSFSLYRLCCELVKTARFFFG